MRRLSTLILVNKTTRRVAGMTLLFFLALAASFVIANPGTLAPHAARAPHGASSPFAARGHHVLMPSASQDNQNRRVRAFLLESIADCASFSPRTLGGPVSSLYFRVSINE